MLIGGFQPLSLLDYPGVICSIVFTQGCPLRCAYCHNPDLIPVQSKNKPSLISEDTVLSALKQRRRMIEGVCVTGGEPTVHADLPTFLKKLKQLGFLVKLDTNGVHPTMIEHLINKRLVDFLAMDLKHTWDRYSDVIGLKQKQVIENCQKTFRCIQHSSIPHEFRTTVYAGFHTEHDLETIAAQLRDGERYALQEIRYTKMLDPCLPKKPPLDLDAIARRIQTNHPALHVEVRT